MLMSIVKSHVLHSVIHTLFENVHAAVWITVWKIWDITKDSNMDY